MFHSPPIALGCTIIPPFLFSLGEPFWHTGVKEEAERFKRKEVDGTEDADHAEDADRAKETADLTDLMLISNDDDLQIDGILASANTLFRNAFVSRFVFFLDALDTFVSAPERRDPAETAE